MSHEQNNGTTTLTFRVRPLEPPATDGSCAWLLASISRASDGGLAVNNWPWIFVTLMGTITYPTCGKSNSSSKVPLGGDMLVPRMVSLCIYSYRDELLPTCRISRVVFFQDLYSLTFMSWFMSLWIWTCAHLILHQQAQTNIRIYQANLGKKIWNWRW